MLLLRILFLPLSVHRDLNTAPLPRQKVHLQQLQAAFLPHSLEHTYLLPE